MYGQNAGGSQSGPHNHPYRRDFSTARMEDQQGQDSDQGNINNPTPQASQEPQYNGSYVLFPPNQSKRDKLLTMANKEEVDYNSFLESRRPGPIHLTPKKLGGETSEAITRQQQQLKQSQSKYQKQFQRDEYKRRQREEEEAKLQEMKDKQRKKAEKLEEKRRQEQIERRERWQENMLKKNNEFLDQLSQSTNSPSSYKTYGKIPSAWERSSANEEEQDWNRYTEQDEEKELQLAMRESMKMKREEDQKRQNQQDNQPWQERSSRDNKELGWVPRAPQWKEYAEQDEDWTLQQALKESMETVGQRLYKQQFKEEEEERSPYQMKEEHCRQESQQSYRSYKQQLKQEEERKLQEMKEEQRRKSELLEVKKAEEEKERQRSQQEEQRRKNNAFLDKLQRQNTRQHEFTGESNTWA